MWYVHIVMLLSTCVRWCQRNGARCDKRCQL